MRASDVRGLSDEDLRAGLRELVVHDRTTTVRLLIHIGEFDSRRLYREAAYQSMHDYCVGELKMSSDVAYKRNRVARFARRWPTIYQGIADGSLTVTGVSMLSKYMTEANGSELLKAAADKTNDQIAALIAERFPKADLPFLLQPMEPAATALPVAALEALPHADRQELAASRKIRNAHHGEPQAEGEAGAGQESSLPPSSARERRRSAGTRARCVGYPAREAQVRRY
jgi:hypothetical protein